MTFCRQFKLGEESSRISIFKYSSKVDKDTEIKLIDSVGISIEQLKQKLNKIPYSGEGFI